MTLKTLVLVGVLLALTSCVSVTAKVCTEIPDMLKDRVPAWVPKDGCPVDFQFSNLMPKAPQQE